MPPPPPSPQLCGPESTPSSHSGYSCAVSMAQGVALDFAIVGRAFSALITCDAAGCASWLGLGFAPSAGRMLGATAVVKLPDADNSIKLFRLDGKSPAMVREADPADYTAWRLRDERIEVADGRRGLHFTVDLPASIALDAVHLIFAGGGGTNFTYHGIERGGFTLDLMDAHYHYMSHPPPAPPPQPTCSTLTVESFQGFPCAVQLGPSMELHYHLSVTVPTTLRARLNCRSCDADGWIALGFPQQAGVMPGTKAIVAMGSGVVAYALNERAASAVQPLSAPVQAELLDASVERGEGGVTMEFVAQVGEGGVPASLGARDLGGALSPTPVLYASGSFADAGATELSYHGRSRGGAIVTFEPRNVYTRDLNATLGLEAQQEVGMFTAYFRDMEPGFIALAACSVGVILGALIVGIADRTRCWVKLRGYGRTPPPPPPSTNPPVSVLALAKSSSSVGIDVSFEAMEKSIKPAPPPPGR